MGPQYAYYLAIGFMVLIEAVRPGTFGRPLGVVVGVFFLSFAAYAFAIQHGWDIEAYDSMYMPRVQVWLRLAGFTFLIALARNPTEHFIAAMFAVMATIDGLRLADLLWANTWWWAIFWVSVAQLVMIGLISDAHPIGRRLRTWAQRVFAGFEMRALTFWRRGWA